MDARLAVSRTANVVDIDSTRLNMRHTALLTVILLAQLGAPAAQDKDEPVAASQFMKVYSSGAAEFDKAYKGKTVTIEGIVANSGVKSGQKTFLMITGYKKPGAGFSDDVRCEETTADFEGIRVGHKVRI